MGKELYAEVLLLEMWGDAVLKTLMNFVTIFVLFSLHLSPSWGWGMLQCWAPSPKAGNTGKITSAGAQMDVAQEEWSQWGGFISSDPHSLSLHRRNFSIPKSFSWSSSSSEGLCASFSMSKAAMVQQQLSSLPCRSRLGAPHVPWVPWNLQKRCLRTHSRADGLLGADLMGTHQPTHPLPCQAAQVPSAKAVSAAWGCLLFVFQQVSIALAPGADVPIGGHWILACIV